MHHPMKLSPLLPLRNHCLHLLPEKHLHENERSIATLLPSANGGYLIFPAVPILSSIATCSNDEPASWKLVTPFFKHSSSASLILSAHFAFCTSLLCWLTHAPYALPTSPCAFSEKTPTIFPLLSFKISPPEGFFVDEVIPASSSAFAFT